MKSLQELRALDVSSLNQEVETMKKSIFDAKMALLTGQVKDTSHFRKTRKAIAQALTILNQKKQA